MKWLFVFSTCFALAAYLLWAGCAVLMEGSPNPFADPFATLAFNLRDWLEDADCSDSSNRRGHMARDIMDHRLRRGMSEQEVVALLGEPTEGKQPNVFDPEKIRFMRFTPVAGAAYTIDYYLGQDLGVMHGVQRAWLYLYFDKRNRCVDWRIWQP
jgi:hypothetical protein